MTCRAGLKPKFTFYEPASGHEFTHTTHWLDSCGQPRYLFHACRIPLYRAGFRNGWEESFCSNRFTSLAVAHDLHIKSVEIEENPLHIIEQHLSQHQGHDSLCRLRTNANNGSLCTKAKNFHPTMQTACGSTFAKLLQVEIFLFDVDDEFSAE